MNKLAAALALIVASPIAGGLAFSFSHPAEAKEIRRNAYAHREPGQPFFYASEAEAHQAAIRIYP